MTVAHPPDHFRADPQRRIRVTAPTTSFDVQPLVPAPPAGWVGPALGEWVLEDATLVDCHPFDELAYVIEGELQVTAAGSTAVARPGEVIRVRAGTPAQYTAVGRARMLYIYGDNARGLRSELLPALPDDNGSGASA
jgi:ethanolamine utilization protein EutQ (cupin superfamily)